ncbi:MAG: D-alanyl-D-alanine carboxypeptidase [Clostridiales bacterium]|nr:D-alanyl-D-alanine carboxypeptidase [Clostridiales bacterium]
MKYKIRQLLCFLLAFQIFAMTAWAKPDWPSDTGILAEAGIVMDADSGAILFGQNIHIAYAPASITKILTALIVLEHCQLDETVTFTEEAVSAVEADSGNKLSVRAGDTLSVEDCLYGMLLVSANQAANALAIHVAGSIEAFADLMNERIAGLGCTESHFDNPSGLNGDTQYVTAHDMALIAQAAYRNEELLAISRETSHRIGGVSLFPDGQTVRQENRLLITTDTASEYYYPPAVAGKTGYLLAAGNTLVIYAEQDGRHLISVILKGQSGQYYLDCKSLLEFGFRSFQNLEIAGQEARYVSGDEIINLDVGSFPASDLEVESGRVITLPVGASFADADLSLEALPAEHPERATALLRYTYNDRTVGEAFLMAKENVAVAIADGTEPEPTEQETAETPAPEEPDQDATPSDFPVERKPIDVKKTLVTGAIIALLAVVAGLLFWIIRSRKKEAAALAERRARRRERLKAYGQEEEFERLLAQRKGITEDKETAGSNESEHPAEEEVTPLNVQESDNDHPDAQDQSDSE